MNKLNDENATIERERFVIHDLPGRIGLFDARDLASDRLVAARYFIGNHHGNPVSDTAKIPQRFESDLEFRLNG